MRARLQRGMALAIVLWFLAGMSLLVAGITHLARIDTKMAQLHLARATAASAGDGAILLMLAGVAGGAAAQAPVNGPLAGDFRVGPQSVSVVMVPAGSLIDLNTAPTPVLARLFTLAARLPEAAAQALAENVVAWRTPSVSSPSEVAGGRFLAPEDILRVPGVTRALWDGIRDFVVAAEGGAAGGSPGFAVTPDTVMAMLETVSTTTPGAAGKTGSPAGNPASAPGAWRLDALVNAGGSTWLRRKWVVLGGGGDSPLPWRFARVEAPRVIGAERVGR